MKKSQRIRIIQGLKAAKDTLTKINCSVGVAIRRQGRIFGESINFYPILRPKDIQYLVSWMDEMLDGSFYIEQWLKRKGFNYKDPEYVTKVKLDWIDYMIAEMEKP